VTHSVSGVVCDLLRARVAAENEIGGSQKFVCEGLTSQLSFLRIVTHSVLGVVCDLLRTRVTASNQLEGSQKCDCEGFTSLN